MTTKTVRAGKTLIENGTNAASDILNLQGGAGGGPGGIVLITTSASNAGTINIAGGAASTVKTQAGSQGGLLDVIGVLTDSGAIVVGAGATGRSANATGQGGQLLVSGTLSVAAAGSITLQGDTGIGVSPNGGVLTNAGQLDNAGLITMNGAGGFGLFYGYGSVLDSSGTLSNTGTILVQGGGYSSGQGANLIDSGVMTNSGLIMLEGGSSAGIYTGFGSGGGTLAVTGKLTNTGSIVLGGGASGYYRYGQGYGGTVLNSGTLDNRGAIEIQGGGSFDNMGVNGTGGQLVDTGNLLNQGSIKIDGSAATQRYPISGGGTLAVSGSLSGYGRILIAGGGGANPTGPNGGANYYAGSGGVLVDSGGIYTGLYNGGNIMVGGGQASTLQNYDGGSGGTLSITSTGDLANLYAGGVPVTVEGGAGAAVAGKGAAGHGGVLDLAGNFEQGGALILQAGSAGKNGHASGGGATMILSGTLEPAAMTIQGGGTAGAAASASLTITATGTIDGQFGKGVDLENAGRIVLQAGAFINGSIYGSKLGNSGVISGSGTIARTSIVNTGTIDAGTGQLLLKGDTITSGAAPGQLDVGLGGTLTISGGTIDAAQSAVLAGASAMLAVTGSDAGVLVKSSLGGTLDITGGGSATLNTADSNLSVFLSSATNLTLSRMGAIAATGSSAADTITALASGQTVTGGLGVDHLTGAAATGDIFRDIAAGLNGDTIAGFAGTDTIDITDFAPGAGLTLAYAQQGATGQLTLFEGSASTTITLQGNFTAASFTTASDLHGGLQISLHG